VRPAAQILLIEASALRPILEATSHERFSRETVCARWSVRDVLAHCGAALTAVAAESVHRFMPEDNQRDVDERSTWELSAVLDELFAGYEAAAAVIDAAGGPLDGVGIGEWVHGGDVRDALGVPGAYISAGSELALGLLLECSLRLEKPGLDLQIDGEPYRFGVDETAARLVTDLETFVRLCGGRNPDPERYRLEGVSGADVVLFT
jgi:uncharacterized protein (TIGR03083 family)